jgi:hypothetical protein
MKESDLDAFIAQDPTRWAKTLHKTDSPSIPMEIVTGAEALSQARAALLALVHLLLPEGQPIDWSPPVVTQSMPGDCRGSQSNFGSAAYTRLTMRHSIAASRTNINR